MQLKQFLLDNRNIERDSFIWNMLGSLLSAFQSVIMLVILTHTLGLTDAGIFTIAYANANLFLNIGKYGMRYFQVSDIEQQFTFAEYKSSRIFTTITMIAVSVGYTLYTAVARGYSIEKTQIIIWMCLWKAIEAIEDVYHGLYQNKARLDIASRALTLRLMASIFVFIVSLFIWQDQLLALILTTLTTTVLFVFFTKLTYREFDIINSKTNWKDVAKLLQICFPLFAGAFLSFYIGNAPKYAIDAMLSDELQACYGFIAMPVFVIGLLNNFIFNPMLYQMSVLWNQRNVKKFVKKTMIQMGIVVVITVVCILGADWLGVPVLSVMYNTDLTSYKKELLILLLGGGFLGLSGLLNAVITIIRYQKSLMWGYATIAILAFLFSDKVVGNYGLFGASVLYTTLMGGLCIIFGLLFIRGILKGRRDK